MDHKNKLALAWTVAAVLAVLLVIALYFAMNPRKDLDTVLREGKEDITQQRDRIAEVCEGAEANDASCKDELDELADILRDFSKDINKATSTAPAASAE